jgi:murein DD-endopeptidase MepM/ murein hydrolase activator NlpD
MTVLAVAAYAIINPTPRVPAVSSESNPADHALQLAVTYGTPATAARSTAPASAGTTGQQAPDAGDDAAADDETTETSVDLGEMLRVFAAGISPSLANDPRLLCEPGQHFSYCVYTVREGDTLSEIAEIFDLNGGDVPGWELLVASNKPNLVSADDFIQPGQKLRIPTRRGVVHTVILGETVGDLAEGFDVTSAEIIAANALGTGNLLQIGQVLLIVDPKQIPQPQVEEPAPAIAPPPPPPPAPPAPAPDGSPRHASSGFIWPIKTTIRITNYFSSRHPLGIDLGLSHDPRTPIYAVQSGRVTFAGGDPCCSYGYYVIVDHGNGIKTLYAHLRRIDVALGQTVQQGTVLGLAGSTGYSTGAHLHFEVHLNNKRVNPLNYLP